ncbi:hypothetical protein B0H14DRAFT_1565035 [Mycena olivaceomarginata]|nr:hypothetical protein B0H14DRAFT_1565035 [Mycena olivaceomarginata]
MPRPVFGPASPINTGLYSNQFSVPSLTTPTTSRFFSQHSLCSLLPVSAARNMPARQAWTYVRFLPVYQCASTLTAAQTVHTDLVGHRYRVVSATPAGISDSHSCWQTILIESPGHSFCPAVPGSRECWARVLRPSGGQEEPVPGRPAHSVSHSPWSTHPRPLTDPTRVSGRSVRRNIPHPDGLSLRSHPCLYDGRCAYHIRRSPVQRRHREKQYDVWGPRQIPAAFGS